MNKDLSNLIKAMEDLVDEAKIEGATVYNDDIIEGHFESDNVSEYGYPLLSQEYQKEKREKVGIKPQLVSSGKLRNSVVGVGNVKDVGNDVQIEWTHLPNYADSVLKIRDFLTPSLQDEEDIHERMEIFIEGKINDTDQ